VSRASEIHAKFFPPTRPIVTADPSLWRVGASKEDMATARKRRIEERLAAAVAHALASPDPAPRSMFEIAEEVAEKHGFASWRDLRQRSGKREIVYPRQEANNAKPPGNWPFLRRI
jgi:hypothetical protein